MVALCAMPIEAHLQSYSFAWGASPSTSSYVPPADFAYSDAGHGSQIIRTGPGSYEVHFNGLENVTEALGNVQISAYGSGTTDCQVGSWNGDIAQVKCFATDGTASDARFSLIWAKQEPHTGEIAYVWADQPSEPVYSPTGAFNPSGSVEITRSSAGSYSATFFGFEAVGLNSGHVQISAIGSSPTRCKVLAWGSNSVDVRCRDYAGSLVDSKFSILFQKPELDREGLAFAWVDNPGASSSTPISTFSYNSGGGAIQVTRLGTGDHEVQWSGMEGQGINGGNAQVTAYGSGDARCKVNSWGSATVRILCFSAAGAAVDTPFAVLLHKTPRGLFTQQYAFGYANQLSVPSYTGAAGTSYNAGGGPIEISHFAVGVSSIGWPGMSLVGSDLGVVLVSSHTVSGSYCKVESWNDEQAIIRCYDGVGFPADKEFNALYFKPDDGTPGVAYAWANQPNQTVPYTPPPAFSHNPTGAGIQVSRVSIGSYSVTWSGYGATAPTGGHVQVTAVGTSTDRCSVVSWSADTVAIDCHTHSGAASDSAFAVVYLKPDEKRDGIAFAWANLESTTLYNPASEFSYNPSNQEVLVGRDTDGRYSVRFRGFEIHGIAAQTGTGGHYQVSAYGSSGNYCKTRLRLPNGSAIDCDAPFGMLADSKFNVLQLRPINLPEPGAAGGLIGGVLLLTLLRRRRRP